MQHRQVINVLGGYRVLAVALARTPSRVFRWQEVGIPSHLWPEIAQRAAAAGRPDITVQVLTETAPQIRIRRDFDRQRIAATRTGAGIAIPA